MKFDKINDPKSFILCQAEVIHAVHLLNDFSGSPLVFLEALREQISKGKNVKLYTATPSGQGFLSELNPTQLHPLFYKWSKSKLVTFIFFLFAQFSIFLKLLKNVQKNDVVYMNTLLPFFAIIAGKIKGAKIIVHIHEVSLKPLLLKNIAVRLTEEYADEVIFVSNYLKNQYKFKKPKCVVLFNRLPIKFEEIAQTFLKQKSFVRKNILMLCSMKDYKGINEFLALSRILPELKFELVLNASNKEVNRWILNHIIPANCLVFSAQANTHQFYQRAAVVMNLSRPDEWIETFGMTILEAITYKCYVIVPPVGGPKELLEKYQFGKALDGKNFCDISLTLKNHFEELSQVEKAIP